MPNTGSISDLIFAIIELGGNAMQIFINDPNDRSPPRPISNPELIQQMLENTGIFLVVHGKYIYNFCRSISWQKEALVKELQTASQLGPNVNVVIHQGKNIKALKLNHQEAIQTYVDNLKTVIAMTPNLTNRILLENSCQQGTEIGYSLTDLAEIWSRFTKKEQERLGFCLDTCHIYVAGQLEFKNAQEVKSFFQEFDQLIGISNLRLIHFNDSKTKFDGHNDHHGDFNHGFITNTTKGGTLEGVKALANLAKEHEIPMILETPMEAVDSSSQIKLVKSWVHNK
jgi:deoxyribonuclease-4